MDDMNHDDRNPVQAVQPQSSEPEVRNEKPRGKSRVRKALRWSAFGLAGLLGLVTVSAGGGLLFLRSDSGERWLTSTINDAMSALPSGLSAHVDTLRGPLFGRAYLEGLVLKDKHGEWLTAKGATLRIDWGSLPSSFVISEISVDSPVLLRVPELEPRPEPAPAPEGPSASPEELLVQLDDFLKAWPGWLPELRIDELALRSAQLTRGVTPYPLTASVQGSASAGRAGLNAGISIVREDGPLPASAPNRRASLKASLEPGLVLELDTKLSDLGFAPLFLPENMAKQPAILLSLQGKAPIQDWEASLSGSLRDDAVSGEVAARSILTLAGSLGLRPLEKAPDARLSLGVETGALAPQFWTALGQKNGRLNLKLDSKAAAGTDLQASTSLDIALADMQWGTAELDALLGSAFSAGTSAELRAGKDGTLRASLEKFSAKAAHLGAEVSGNVILNGGNMARAGSRADVQASFALKDATALLPDLSGDLSATASVSGPFTALAAKLDILGSHLDTPSTRIRDVDVHLSIPSADIAALTGASRSARKGALLDGAARASLVVNEQPMSLDSDWKAEDSGKALRFMLEDLALRVGSNSIEGHLKAEMAKSPAAPAKGTIAEMAGAALPLLDGRLDISLPGWDTLSALSGLPLSGAPLQAELSFSHADRQNMAFMMELPSFKTFASGKDIELSAVHADIKASDLWGRPAVDVLAGLGSAGSGKMTLGETSLSAQGGLDAVDMAFTSTGGLESDIKAHWKPGELRFDTLAASLLPAQLGLPEGPAVGLNLVSPAVLSYGDDTVSVRDLTADLLPAGRLELAGRYSPARLEGRMLLDALALDKYQHMLPGLPAGNVTAQAEFSGTPKAPSGNFKLNLKEILVSGASLPPVDTEISGALGMHGKRRMFHAQVDLPENTQKALGLTRFVCKADVPFTSPADGVSLPDMKAPLKAELSLGGQLEGLWKLVPAPDQRLSGLIDLDASVKGSASAPIVTAHVDLQNGTFLELMQGVELRGIQLKVDAEDVDFVHKKAKQRIDLALSARDAYKGTLDVGGWLDPATMALDIEGALKALSPLRRPDLRVQLSGDLSVEGTVQSPLVKADISVDKGELQLAKLPGGSIPTLEIWTPEEQKKADEAPAVPGRLDVRVNIPNQFFVRGYGLDCEWGGKLRIDAPLTEPAVSGRLSAVRGSLDILGKNFKLAEGEIRFDGGWPVSPLLNIDMRYEASNLTADILVGGSSSDPKLTLTSQPEMPQDEILSQIMFGSSAGSLSHAQALQLASGAASLAGFGSASVMDFGRELLGVDVFKVNSDNDGEDSDVSRTSLEMGTYVRDNVYVGVEQGMGRESQTGAVVEIELTPRLELQAKASGSDTEVGLEWKKNY